MLYFCTVHVWSNPLHVYITFSWLGNSIWVGALLWICLSGSISEMESNSYQGLLELIICLMASHAEWLWAENQSMSTITSQNWRSVWKTTWGMEKAEIRRWQFPTSSWWTGVELIQYNGPGHSSFILQICRDPLGIVDGIGLDCCGWCATLAVIRDVLMGVDLVDF